MLGFQLDKEISDEHDAKFCRVHRAGPREKIYFKPEGVKAAIVTCGGLCPGLNDVIRQVFSFNDNCICHNVASGFHLR